MNIDFTVTDVNRDPTMSLTPENSTIFYTAGEETLRIAKDGFYVRGKKVPVDDNESKEVYNAFRQWLIWQNLSHE